MKINEMSFLNGLFILPSKASGLYLKQGKISFLRLKRARSLAVDLEIHEPFDGDLAAFVKKHGLENEAITIAPSETEAFNKIVSSEEITDESYEGMMTQFLPKGADPDAAALDFIDLPGKRKLLSFIKTSAQARLTENLEKAGLFTDRIACGAPEIGLCLQGLVEKDFTGAVLIVEEQCTWAAVFEAGEFFEAERLTSGTAHFQSDKNYYFNEVQKYISYYRETKLFRESLKKLCVITEDPGVEGLFREKGYEISPSPTGITAQNAFVLSLARNTLLKKHEMVDHLPMVHSRLKRIKAAEQGTGVLTRFVFPVLGLLIIAAVLVFGAAYGLDKLLLTRISSKQSSITHLSTLIKKTNEMEDILAQSRVLAGASIPKAKILQAISTSIPDNIFLNKMDLSKESSLSIEGLGQNENDVPLFIASLEKIGMFNSIRLKFTERIEKKDLSRLTSFRTSNPNVRFGLDMKLNDKVNENGK